MGKNKFLDASLSSGMLHLKKALVIFA